MKVVILGAGVGGLSAAHELVKLARITREHIDITVVERHESVGGQARAVTLPNGEHCEYCWHAIGIGYVHFASILKEIETIDGSTVLDHLKPIEKYMYGRKDGHYFEESINSFLTGISPRKFYNSVRECGGHLTLKDMWILVKTWFYANMISDETMEKQDAIKWGDYMKELSPEAQIWLVNSTSIFLGMDYAKLSAHMMLDLFRHNVESEHLPGPYNFYSFDGPIHEVWLNPWAKYLEKQGVKFYFKTKITRIVKKDDQIVKVIANHNDEEVCYTADEVDWFVNGLPIEIMSKLLGTKMYKQLAIHTHQIQTQVLYKFDTKLNIDKSAVLIFPDTPWFLMSRHEGVLWNTNDYDYLSTGIGIWDRKGALYNKTANECTPVELAEECWYQMNTLGSGVMKQIMCDNVSLYKLYTMGCVPKWNIWNSFYHTGMSLTTYEPKFSNNVNTLSHRPLLIDAVYSNLGHAVAYARTDTNIFCMESAVEAGRRVASHIVYGNTENDKPRTVPRNWLYKILRKIF